MLFRIGDLVEGEVREIRGQKAIVDCGGTLGYLPFSEARARPAPGERIRAKVIGIDPQGRPILSIKGLEGGPEGAGPEAPFERRLEHWIREAERALERLRRNRQRRLSAKFYTD